MDTYVMAFESTHAAMASQRALADMPGFALIPTPARISAGCGMSLMFAAASDGAAIEAARSSRDARGLAALYRRDGEAFCEVARL